MQPKTLRTVANEIASETTTPHVGPEGFMAFDEYCETVATVQQSIVNAAEEDDR